MPGLRLVRSASVRQAPGDGGGGGDVHGPDGQAKGAGTNVFDLAAEGRITRVVGLWKP